MLWKAGTKVLCALLPVNDLGLHCYLCPIVPDKVHLKSYKHNFDNLSTTPFLPNTNPQHPYCPGIVFTPFSLTTVLLSPQHPLEAAYSLDQRSYTCRLLLPLC